MTLSGDGYRIDARYHVPPSQVWEGSRGRQRGNVHLHVVNGPAEFVSRRGRATTISRGGGVTLCGKLGGWYERPPEPGDKPCRRCAEMAIRYGIEWPEAPDVA